MSGVRVGILVADQSGMQQRQALANAARCRLDGCFVGRRRKPFGVVGGSDCAPLRWGGRLRHVRRPGRIGPSRVHDRDLVPKDRYRHLRHHGRWWTDEFHSVGDTRWPGGGHQHQGRQLDARHQRVDECPGRRLRRRDHPVGHEQQSSPQWHDSDHQRRLASRGRHLWIGHLDAVSRRQSRGVDSGQPATEGQHDSACRTRSHAEVRWESSERCTLCRRPRRGPGVELRPIPDRHRQCDVIRDHVRSRVASLLAGVSRKAQAQPPATRSP